MVFKKFVEPGRVVLINYGPLTGKLAVIVDIINTSKVLVHGPNTGVRRQEVSIQRLSLTEFKLDIPRGIHKDNLMKAIESFDLAQKWGATGWARKLEKREKRKNNTDFDRFKCCNNPSAVATFKNEIPTERKSKFENSKTNKTATEADDYLYKPNIRENSNANGVEPPNCRVNGGSNAKERERDNPYKYMAAMNMISNDCETDNHEKINSIIRMLDKAPKLNLEIINSSALPPGMLIKINALGMENSLRGKKDGYIYFGYQEGLEKGQTPLVDYLIRPKDQEYDNRFLGRHFQITFNPEFLKYYIKDLGNGFGTFVKIQSENILKDNSLINIGDSYIISTLGIEDDTIMPEDINSNHAKIPSQPHKDYSNLLNIKIFSGNAKYDPMNFQPSKSAIRIGRSSECEVSIDDNMLSRVHCTIEYLTGIGWIVRDGSVVKAKDGSIHPKYSTNGTWLYAMEDTPIYDGMIFKSNHNLFEV